MASEDSTCAGSNAVMKSYTDLWEELYEKISSDGKVSSETADLVIAMTDLNLPVTEDQVVRCKNQVLPFSRNTFTKEEFKQFSEAMLSDTAENDIDVEDLDKQKNRPKPWFGSRTDRVEVLLPRTYQTVCPRGATGRKS